MELELDLAHVVSIWLSANLSLDVVGPENGLFDFHIRKSNKRGTERLHRIRGLLAIEDHSVGGEINPATLGALENGIVLTGELHGDTVAVEQYVLSSMDEHAIVGVSRINRHVSLIFQLF